MIVLMSSDNEEIPVGTSHTVYYNRSSFPLQGGSAGTETDIPMIYTEREVAERSILIKNMMEDVGDAATAEAIPIPNVCSQVNPSGRFWG